MMSFQTALFFLASVIYLEIPVCLDHSKQIQDLGQPKLAALFISENFSCSSLNNNNGILQLSPIFLFLSAYLPFEKLPALQTPAQKKTLSCCTQRTGTTHCLMSYIPH